MVAAEASRWRGVRAPTEEESPVTEVCSVAYSGIIYECVNMLNRISNADRCDLRDSHANIEFKDRSMTFQAQFSQIRGPDTAESMIKVKRS